MPGPLNASPFVRAAQAPRFTRLFVWGPPGSGKTTLALDSPRPGLIDLEDGANHYGDRFDFGVLRARSYDEVVAAVEWIHAHPDAFSTVIVDPSSVLWEATQRKWSKIFLQRNRGAKGHRHEFYDLGPKEWGTIKAAWREFLQKLFSLKAHVIVTAREKPRYSDTGFMHQIGVAPDAEKSLPYLFDIVLRLCRDDDGRFMTTVVKDRTATLPSAPFETNFGVLEPLFPDLNAPKGSVPRKD